VVERWWAIALGVLVVLVPQRLLVDHGAEIEIDAISGPDTGPQR
jgi:hypothetical protein